MVVRSQLPRKKAPNPTDQHVGSRVRMRRMMLAMSQGKLGAALGLTFQQVQKYEKGTNRIGASRLQQISDILRVPVAFFFEGAPSASAPRGPDRNALSIAQIDDFVASSDGLRLIGSPSFLPLQFFDPTGSMMPSSRAFRFVHIDGVAHQGSAAR